MEIFPVRSTLYHNLGGGGPQIVNFFTIIIIDIRNKRAYTHYPQLFACWSIRTAFATTRLKRYGERIHFGDLTDCVCHCRRRRRRHASVSRVAATRCGRSRGFYDDVAIDLGRVS